MSICISISNCICISISLSTCNSMSISICISNTVGSSKWYFCLSSQRVGWGLLHVPGMPLIQLQKQRSINVCISICINICISICIPSGTRNVTNTITKTEKINFTLTDQAEKLLIKFGQKDKNAFRQG